MTASFINQQQEATSLYVLIFGLHLLVPSVIIGLFKLHSAVRGCSTSIHKKLVGLHAPNYTERLELLGLERLESRRIRAVSYTHLTLPTNREV